MASLISKIIRASWEGCAGLFRSSPSKIVMTLLVKNEEDLLESNLLFHKEMGVDYFIITDNNSTDKTPAIIQKYVEKGWVVEVIKETATNYEQKEWVDRMIWIAKTKYNADWIINSDADEFWYPQEGDFHVMLSSQYCNILKCVMRSMFPEEGKPFYEWEMAVKTVDDIEKYDLSRYSMFERQNYKVIHRTKGYLQISMGNHKVKMFPQISKESRVIVYHYNIRGRERFINKMINGGKQLEQHKGRHGGRHWRYFYSLYKEGKLNEEYDRVIGLNHFSDLKKDGYIFIDERISNKLRYIETLK